MVVVMTPTLQMRPYQLEAIDAVMARRKAGVRRQLVRMATGLGKTVFAMGLVRRLADEAPQLRVLVLVHRDELVQQTLKAVALWLPEFTDRLGVVKAERNETDEYFVVASVQTLAIESRRQLLMDSQVHVGEFGLVISDEHHLSPTPTWAQTLEALGCGGPDGPLMVGLTATPNRHDGVGLNSTTDEIVVDLDIVWAIANGYLVPPKGITVKVDLSTVKIEGGDYQAKGLGDVLEMDGAHIAVAKLIHEHAAERKTIVFTPTVRFAELVAAECTQAGLPAEIVSGETPLPERRAMYDRLRSGETRVITNCNVLQEGFDEPSVDCIVNAKPTRSTTAFTQRVGRGLRLFPGKEDCLVIALAGSERNKLATLASLAGRTWEDAMKAREAGQPDEEEFDFVGELDKAMRDVVEQAKYKDHVVDLLGSAKRKVTWVKIDAQTYGRSIPVEGRSDRKAMFMFIKQDWRGLDWRVVGGWRDHDNKVHYRRMLEGVDLPTAQAYADDEIRRRVPGRLLDPKAEWRRHPVTDGQQKAMKAWRVRDKAFNAGQASDLLDRAILQLAAAAA